MNFAALDLNLLRVFDALAREQSTVRAGERIGLSQPAVSAALGRLRHFTGDELFTRDGNRMVPTPRALELVEPVRAALASLEQSFANAAAFDPATAETALRLGGSDYFSALLMPELARRALPDAGGIRLQMLDCRSSEIQTLLSDDRIDVAIDRSLEMPGWIRAEKLFTSSLVCLLREGHPAEARFDLVPEGSVPIELFGEIPQVLRSADGSTIGTMDAALARESLSRRVAMTVPHFQAVALVVASSDLMGSLPVHFARHVARFLPVRLYATPFPSPEMEVFMYWHRRHDRDGASLWLRKQLADLARDSFGSPPQTVR